MTVTKQQIFISLHMPFKLDNSLSFNLYILGLQQTGASCLGGRRNVKMCSDVQTRMIFKSLELDFVLS